MDEEGIKSELISDDFTCPVCLDVLYKPIILVCGHVSCFWCCQHSMHSRSESHCPLCRHPYRHFPAICRTFHFLIKKLYPVSYERRKIQTLEDEKRSSLGSSPDIDSFVTSENNDVGQSSDQSSKYVTVSDVLCAACKQLLFRPVVLNCGHVYCESCITIPTEGVLKCQVCECRHPSGLPKICRELDNFIEEQFSAEYASRKSSIQPNHEQTQNNKLLIEAGIQVPKLSFPTEENFIQWWVVHGSKMHEGAGCDMCGMCPIIGERYRCKDCTEISGYDLCGDCYKTGSNLPGRFNQKHTPAHRLELVKRVINRPITPGQLLAVSAIASRNRSTLTNASPDLSSSDEDSVSSHPTVSSSATSEDQTDNQPSI